VGGATFDYARPPTALVDRAQAMQRLCADFGVELPAAALQFAMRHPAVTTVLFGARSAAEVHADVAYTSPSVPAGLWHALETIR
jgi:D-threo-aldose 1-dehydrogenase